MQKYSTYKPSNVEWLGNVPSHWKVDRLKMIDEIIMGQSPSGSNVSDTENGIPFLQGNAEFGEFNPKHKYWSTEITKEALEGDILFSVRASIGDINFADKRYVIGRGLCAIRPIKSDIKFIYYSLIGLKDYFKSIATGTTFFAININDIKDTKLSFPAKTEQTAIAAYLDQATSNIDKVIATKQKQLEKLEQYKQSKIHECVTKGLNPDVTLKPSGIDWIGNVPSHWKVERLKDVCSDVTSGGTPKTSVEEFWDGEIIWLSPTDFQDFENSHYINNSRRKITDKGLNDCSASILPIGTVIMQSRASIGAVKISSVELCTNQGFINFVTSKLLNNRYLFYLIDVYLGYYFANVATGTTFMEMSRTKAKQEKIPLPEIQEQTVIVDFLDSFCNKISKEKSIIEQQIEKLKQYRKCLIHECVTGKRKVIKD